MLAIVELHDAGIAGHGHDLGAGVRGADGEVADVVDLQLPAVVVDLVPAVVFAAEHAVALRLGEVVAASGEIDDRIGGDGLQ